MKKITLLISSLLFLLIASNTHAFPKESFVTTTVLVRGQENWTLINQTPIDFPLFYYQQASQSGIPTSYLLRYDAIQDQEISSRLANLTATDSAQLLGGLLEVTPKLAQKANAEYQNHGSFTSANHLFLSGYTREDRLKLIDTYMDAFFNTFGYYPSVVGVDSLDSFSFDYLVSHYSVIAAFTADEPSQGGYLAEPYLPSKTNLLLPAQNSKNKINGVVFKWSPADPLNFYLKNQSSRPISAQIPDILDTYTLKSLNETTHFNIRLDNNYQLIFHPNDQQEKSQNAKASLVNLITQLKAKQEEHTLRFMPASELGELIKARFPETSPASFFKLGDIHWYQNPFYRLVLRQTNEGAEIIDFRVYNPKITGNYFHFKNVTKTDSQEILAVTNSVTLDLNLEKANITSEYWDLILTDGSKILRLEPQKIIFQNFSPPNPDLNQVKIKQTKNSTQWLINPTLPFKELVNSNYFVIKLALIFFLTFLILKTFTRKPPSSSFLRRQESILFLGLVFGFIALIPVVFSGQIYSFGLGLWGPNGHDAIFHLSVINSLKDSLINLSHPQLSGFVLKNYHLGVDWIIALTSKLTGIHPSILLFRWLPIILVAVIVSQLIKLLTTWKYRPLPICLSLFMVFLAGSFGFIFTLLRSGNLFAGESLFWMNQSVSIFLNPPFALSIALLLVFLNLYPSLRHSCPSLRHSYPSLRHSCPSLRHSCESRNLYTSLILIGGLLAQVKIYAFILLLLALLLSKELKLFVAIGLVGLLFSLPTLGLSSSPFVFSPLWFPKSLIAAQDKLNWQKMAQAWQVYEVNGVYLKLFIVNAVALLIYFLGNLGTRVIGLLNILRKDLSPGVVCAQQASPGVRSVVLVKSIILLGLTIPLLFIQANNPWNTIQFSYYSLFFLGLFTAKEFSSWFTPSLSVIPGSTRDLYKSHGFRLKAGMTIILFTILALPTTIGTLKDYITPYSASKISLAELQALETLKNQEKGVVISPIFNKPESRRFPEPKPLYAYTSTAYISAFSGQPEYLSDLINLNITGFNYQERAKNVQRLYRTQDLAWVKEFLNQENITYVYQTPLEKLQIDPQQACLTPIFDSNEIIIYNFNCHE